MKRALLLICLCLGCRQVVIHPIDKSDIFSIPKDSIVVFDPNTLQEVEKDGWFLSDTYVQEVMDAKID